MKEKQLDEKDLKFAIDYLDNGLDVGKAVYNTGITKSTNRSTQLKVGKSYYNKPEVYNYIREQLEKRSNNTSGIINTGEILKFLTDVIRGEVYEEDYHTIKTGYGMGQFEEIFKKHKLQIKCKDRLKAIEILATKFPQEDNEKKLVCIADDIPVIEGDEDEYDEYE